MKRKVLSLLLTVVVAAGMLAGCSSDKGGSDSASDTAREEDGGDSASADDSASPSDGETLTMMCVGTASDAYVETYEAVAAAFSENNEYGVTIDMEFYENEQYKTKLTTLMASNSVTDIFFTWELDYLKPFVEGGKVYSLQEAVDADSEWRDSFSDGALELLSFDGEVHAIPTQSSFCVMFYNKDIFEENNVEVPTTYDEFLEVCADLKANDVTPMSLAATDAWIPAQFIQQICNGIDGMDLYNGIINGERTWDDPTHIQASEEVQKLIDNEYFQSGMLGMSAEEAKEQFIQGKTAMYFMGAWEASTFIADDCAVKDAAGAFIMPAMNPEYDGVVVGSTDTSFAISEECANKEAAIAFLKYFSSEEASQKVLYEQGRLPIVDIDIDESQLEPLVVELVELQSHITGMTAWWDRAFGAGEGVEFNNQCLAVFNGDDAEQAFAELQDFAESNAAR